MCIFFFNDTATTEIYTLSLHDALPIWDRVERHPPARAAGRREDVLRARDRRRVQAEPHPRLDGRPRLDRKSTRLNSSHANISYAVFCLKKTTDQGCRCSVREDLLRDVN